MFTIAIVENDASAADELSNMINKFANINGENFEIFTYVDGASFIDSKKSFNIIFLNLDGNGMSEAQRIRESNSYALMFLMSASDEYAVNGYLVNALGYMLKPIAQQHINFWLDFAGKYLNNCTDERLVVKTAQGLLCVEIDKIIYVEVQAHSIFLHILTDKGIATIKTKGSLSEYEKKLKNFAFARSGGYCFINMNYISAVKNDSVYLGIIDITLPVTRTYKKLFNEKLDNFKKINV